MDQKYDIHKAAGILIQDRKLLVEKSHHKKFFVAPGGKLEKNETLRQALIRELKEEFQISVQKLDLEKFGTFSAPAAGNESQTVRMEVFLVKQWQGDIQPDHEVEQVHWINSRIPSDIQVGSIFEHEVIPRLKSMNLID